MLKTFTTFSRQPLVLFARKKAAPATTSLEAAIKQIESDFGKGSVMKLKSDDNSPCVNPLDFISTGSLTLDIALGTGGLPRGRITELFGPESSGKTTLALHTIAEAQKIGGKCIFIDAEHALDPKYAKSLGVNTDQLYVCQPDYGEQALDIAETLIKSGDVAMIVLDSVAALVPRAELEGDMSQNHVGLHARMMSQALRKLTPIVHKSNTLLIFINQMRMKIGVMFGNPETTTGGRALRHHASVRLDIRRKGQIKSTGDVVLGDSCKVKVAKNKMAPPFGVAEFDMIFSTGISRSAEVLDLSLMLGMIEKAGAWYSLKEDGEKIGQGRERAKYYLENHVDIMNSLEAEIRKQLLTPEEENSSVDTESEDYDSSSDITDSETVATTGKTPPKSPDTVLDSASKKQQPAMD